MFAARPRALHYRIILAAAAGLFAGVARAGDGGGGPGGSTVPSDPMFTAQLVDGTTVSGRIRQIGPRNEVTLVPQEGAEKTIEFGRLVKLTREGLVPSFAPQGSLVLFPDGDRLYRTVLGPATETHIEVQPYTLLGNLKVPLESLLGLVLNPPEDPDALALLVDRVRSEPKKVEALYLTNGERIPGGFLGLDEKKVKFQGEQGPLTVDVSKVVALRFDAGLAVYPMPEGEFFELTMSDGSRLGVTGLKLEQGQLTGTARFGVPIRMALGDLVRVHARSKSIAYLSERKADAFQYVGYVGPTRPYRRDMAVDGHPLRLGGQTYDRGLGTQSRTLLAYRLAPGDRRFQALVGLDDSAGPLGSVVFHVMVDNQERYVSPPMSARDTPRNIDVDVTGGKHLILLTEFGERGEVRDFADWVEARIMR
jgi:hypothetical protein